MRAGTAGAEKDKEGATIASLPKAAGGGGGDEVGPGGMREELRGQIRELASKAIANDPLNAAAYRLLAEATGDPERARGLMREAVKRSRRETAAVFWLLNDSYYRRDFPRAIEYADILVRTRPEMASYGFSYLLNISRDPGGRRLAASLARRRPRLAAGVSGVALGFGAQGPGCGWRSLAELRNTKRPAEPVRNRALYKLPCLE